MTVNIISLYQEFCQNYVWLASVIRPSDSNRFAGVKSRLENIARNYDPDTNQITREFSRNELLLTAFEALRFNLAVGYLRTLNRHHLPIATIRSMCKGPAYHIEEIPAKGNSEGRDIQFEFIMGEYLRRSGFQVREFDDIQISYASNFIRYECKRPASKKTVTTRFEEAVSQLEGKIAQQDNEYGIVALSVEKIDDFDKSFFSGDDIQAVNNVLIQIKDAILDDLRPKLRMAASKKILGVYLFVSSFLADRASGNFQDIGALFTEKAIQEPPTPLHVYLFDVVTEKLQALRTWTY